MKSWSFGTRRKRLSRRIILKSQLLSVVRDLDQSVFRRVTGTGEHCIVMNHFVRPTCNYLFTDLPRIMYITCLCMFDVALGGGKENNMDFYYILPEFVD